MLSSIIILTYNKLDYTQQCIESIREYTDKGSYEIIVVDNASTDGTREWLKSQADIYTVLNESNVGFPKGCNQGIEVANGENIVLLNNDVIVTPGWLDILCNALYSSDDIGAVGPVTNNASNYQAITVSYQNMDEMLLHAVRYNRPNPLKWEQRLRLIGFCMVIKREVVEKIGFLDDLFTPGNFEDDDYSCRIMQAGYRLILCKDVFIHHYGSVSFGQVSESYTKLLETNEAKFNHKWGFKSENLYSIRYDMTNLIDEPTRGESFRVLDVDCGCGGTLLEIKNRFKNVELFGVENNQLAAEFASSFAEVNVIDVEQGLNYPEGYFDYVILSNVLERLRDPWEVLADLKRCLKPNGKILANIFNVMHYSVIQSMLNGQWSYTEDGLLSKSNIRFFTILEIDKLFKETGFKQMAYGSVTLPVSEERLGFIEGLKNLGNQADDHYKVYQFVVKASINNNSDVLQDLVMNLENQKYSIELLNELINIISVQETSQEDLILAVEQSSIAHKQRMYNILGTSLYNAGLYDYVFPLYYASYGLNEKDKETLLNLSFLLQKAGDSSLALHYLQQIEEEDLEVTEMFELLKK